MADRPHVRVEPGRAIGQPHVNAVPVDHIVGMVWAGEPIATVADEYGLGVHEVLVACWYVGRHGTGAWRRRFVGWTATAERLVVAGRWGEVQDPPRGKDRTGEQPLHADATSDRPGGKP